jgi:hypothetical protein
MFSIYLAAPAVFWGMHKLSEMRKYERPVYSVEADVKPSAPLNVRVNMNFPFLEMILVYGICLLASKSEERRDGIGPTQ